MRQAPRRPESFTWNGIPNQRVVDVYHAMEGKYKLNWLRRALRAGCCTPSDLEAMRVSASEDRMRKMWAARDAYFARQRAAKANGAS